MTASAQGPIGRWLSRAPAWAFAAYGGIAAFAAYFSMYAYRKPFAAAEYDHVAGWPFVLDFKIALVIAQVAGYALSKVIGVKVVSETPPARRAVTRLLLVGGAELALVLLGLVPPVLAPLAMFINGLGLGMIWGLVFGFLEGRRLSEVLGAMLCASFILASGVVKSAGKLLLLHGVDERWMPALTGLLFTPLLMLAVAGLSQMPPPDAEDEIQRVRRAPMSARDRAALLARHGPVLVVLVAVYVLLTAVRDFRDNFSAEIWGGLGFGDGAAMFSVSELPIAIIVLAGMAALIRVRDNRRAVGFNLAFIGAGLALLGASTGLHQAGLLGPIGWMVASGAGLYMAYTPFNGMLFDRMIAATGTVGTAGFLIYVADASGYVGSVALLLAKAFAHLDLDWIHFLTALAYLTAVAGLVGIVVAALLFRHERHQEEGEVVGAGLSPPLEGTSRPVETCGIQQV